MSRINTNVTALISSRILANNNVELNKSLERLSTGLRINRGADDPAGLIASENLRKQITGTESAIKNAERAINIVGTADGALIEVSDMLLDLQGLLAEVANTGGMSTEEIDANQLQVDSILNSINRISNSTEFEGIKLLNGNFGYTTSGVSTTVVDELKVNAAKLIDGATMTVSIATVDSADTGIMYLSGTVSTTTAITLQIGSNRGTTELTFAAGTAAAAQRTAINAVAEITGVSAIASGNVTLLRSRDFGSDAYTSVKILGDGSQQTGSSIRVMQTYSTPTTDGKDYGEDYSATVNGTSATGDGKKLTIRTAMLDAEINLTTAAGLSTATETFYITGGGADFALGSKVDAIGLESIGIDNVADTSLGNPTDGYLSTIKSGGTNSFSSTNLYTAQAIVDSAIKDISTLRGRLGSFQKNTLETTINSLKITNENLQSAESAVRDTDFATETSNLTRSQILVQAATSVLAQANFAPQSVLSLLG
jgi:flagellin